MQAIDVGYTFFPLRHILAFKFTLSFIVVLAFTLSFSAACGTTPRTARCTLCFGYEQRKWNTSNSHTHAQDLVETELHHGRGGLRVLGILLCRARHRYSVPGPEGIRACDEILEWSTEDGQRQRERKRTSQCKYLQKNTYIFLAAPKRMYFLPQSHLQTSGGSPINVIPS